MAGVRPTPATINPQGVFKMRTTLCPLLSILLLTSTLGSSCAVFQKLRPALTASALTLLVELEALLRQYESASLPDNPGSGDLLVFNASQDALFRSASHLLDLCHGQIPEKRLREYRARLAAANTRAP
ncbi:hypothetical protein LCGC14_1225200 [marine sediment metagenome]|uniref:Uncharacterized protein n=1 Tax=marine sediment metagenome TaxID=412755 RepID=A0A0F9LXD9_9ZZZZ